MASLSDRVIAKYSQAPQPVKSVRPVKTQGSLADRVIAKYAQPPKEKKVKAAEPTRPLGQKNPNYIAAKARADAAIQEAKKASSVSGMAINALKAAPRAALNTIVGNPIKLGLSTLEVPEIVKNRQYTDRTYNVPGIGPMKSFQSDFGDVSKDVIEGKKGMGSAAWSLAQIPLAGLETGGVARGFKAAYKAKSGADAAKDVMDAFLPTLRNTGYNKNLGTGRQLAGQKGVQGGKSLKGSLPLTVGSKTRTAQIPESVSLQERIQLKGVSGKPLTKGSGVTAEIKVKPVKPGDPLNIELARKLERDQSDVKKALDDVVRAEADEMMNLQQTTGGVSTMRTGNDFTPGDGYKRISSNPKWYSDFYKENGRAPGKKDIREMARIALEKGSGQFQDEYRRIASIGKSIARKQKTISPEQEIDRINAAIQSGDDFRMPKVANVKFKGTESAKVPVKWSRDPRGPVEQINVAQYSDTQKPLSTLRKTFTSGERILQKSGLAGEELKGLLKNEQVDADLLAGKWKSLVKQFTSQLDDKQKGNLVDVLEGNAAPMDKDVATSSVVMRNWLNKVQKTAKDTGLDVGFRENYYPRQYNWDEITKGNRKEEVLQHMVDSGQAATKAEADSFLRDFIGKNRERKAGNLEYERLFDVPGYEKDPEKALTMYADSAARRISEAKAFGPKDEIPSALINKIADGGGDYKEAQKVFDYIYKGEPKNALAQFLLGYNTFTKLSLGFFSNLTQSVNTAAKAGLLNTVKGAGQALAQGVKAVKKQDYDDLAVLANTLDEHVVMQESGLSNRFIQGAMYLFQKVENFNRRTATYAGKYRAEELANVLKADPQSAFAARQLESLGIKVSDAVSGKLTEKQLLTAANKMARITQFKIDALNLPTAWRSPLGKVLMQFKSFSFMQTKFIRDEILKEAKQGNFAPMLRFIAIAPMASYVTQSMRNVVNRVDPENEKSNPSFRRGDLYRKAVGDLPSDFATQMKYAYDKSQATYRDAKGQEYPSTSLVQNIKNFTSPFTGPSIGDAAELLSSLDRISSEKQRNMSWYANHPAAQADPYLNLKRFAATKIPFVGRGLTNTFFNYERSDAKKAKDVFKEGISKNDRSLIDKAIEMDPYLYNERVIQNVIGKKLKEMTPQEKALYDEIKEMRKTKPYYTP